MDCGHDGSCGFSLADGDPLIDGAGLTRDLTAPLEEAVASSGDDLTECIVAPAAAEG
jgi:hypothetical protein